MAVCGIDLHGRERAALVAEVVQGRHNRLEAPAEVFILIRTHRLHDAVHRRDAALDSPVVLDLLAEGRGADLDALLDLRAEEALQLCDG